MQRGEGVKDEKGYDVVRFIEHGGKCRPAMDYVRGQTLISMVSDAVYPAGLLSSK